jgi:hypothetical protein
MILTSLYFIGYRFRVLQIAAAVGKSKSQVYFSRVPDDTLRDVTGDMRIIYENDDIYDDLDGVFTIEELPDAPF